jgi:hypothetical protein
MRERGVLGGGAGKSYFIDFPQHSGHAVALKRSTSDGRTSIAFMHCTQIIVCFMIAVSLALLIVPVPRLTCRTPFKFSTRLQVTLSGIGAAWALSAVSFGRRALSRIKLLSAETFGGPARSAELRAGSFSDPVLTRLIERLARVTAELQERQRNSWQNENDGSGESESAPHRQEVYDVAALQRLGTDHLGRA